MVRIVQKLRLFLFVVAILVGMPAHADTTEIQSVIAYGKTEQNGTPTPTNPVPIMTNNGVLKYGFGKNLFDKSTADANHVNAYFASTGKSWFWAAAGFSVRIPCKPNTTYTARYNGNETQAVLGFGSTDNDNVPSSSASVTVTQGIRQNNPTKNTPITITTGPNDKWLIVAYNSAEPQHSDMSNNLQIEQGSTATAYEPYSGPTGIYVDGLTETIRDSAGHTATAEMLLSVGDYKDEQNITTGAITRKVGVKVLDGTENWDRVFVYGNVKNVVIAPLSSIAPDAKILKNSIRCSHFRTYDGGAFTGSTAGIDWASKYYNSTPSVGIQVPGITTSVAQFKAWLAEQYAAGTPVIIVYPLETETTEPAAVAPQRLTTAPVRQTLGAIMNMPIKTILTDNTEIMSGANELIKIATTKYNEESFEDVQDALTGVFNAVDTVVTQTMTQAQQIDDIANNKQTRPDEGCSAKYCLLVEDEQGVPHWYPIAGADEANPSNP